MLVPSASSNGSAVRWAGIATGFSYRRIWLALPSVLIGALVGVTVAVVPVTAHAIVDSGGVLTAPQFAFFLNYTGASVSAHGYEYYFEFDGMEPNNGTVLVRDTQFYVPTIADEQNRSPSVPSTVYVANSGGVILATFNASDSSFRGPGSGLETPLVDYGGWITGNDTRIVAGDSFRVVALTALTDCEFWVAMDLVSVPPSAFMTSLPF